MRLHYLDNSATTRCCDRAAAAALSMMTEKYGNPSSLHEKGIEAEVELERARAAVAASLSAAQKDVLFTSGSTESNNTVLFGVADAMKRSGRRIIVSAIEHPSVYESAKELSRRGWDVRFVPVDSDGVADVDTLRKLLTADTVLVSVMAVNNETGAVQPTEEIGRIVKANSPALYHVDAVQAYGKLPISTAKWNADFVSVSAHKVHGPKGVGALYIRRSARLVPLLYGGEQQRRLRPGTEATALIAGFGAAVEEFDLARHGATVQQLHDKALSALGDIDGVIINTAALPYIINLSVPGIRSETMLHHLERGGVYVSSSSACAKGKRSYVLEAMGLEDERIDSSLRISFSRYNEEEDVIALCAGLQSGLQTLQRIKK